MKKAKTEPPQDLKTPFDITALVTNDNDCFGVEFSETHKTCVSCHAYETCMAVFYSNQIEQNKVVGESFQDETNWKIIIDKFPKIVELIKAKPKSVQVSDLRAKFKLDARAKDDQAVNTKVNDFLIEFGIKNDNGLYL